MHNHHDTAKRITKGLVIVYTVLLIGLSIGLRTGKLAEWTSF